MPRPVAPLQVAAVFLLLAAATHVKAQQPLGVRVPEGFEVSLVLEATVGFSRVETQGEGQGSGSFDVRVEKAEPAVSAGPEFQLD